MQTKLAELFRHTAQGKQADAILRSCVHCGFCNATCPTYQLLGDERDGPRGRIYLIKQVLEGQGATASTQSHLDRCLTCRNCETTCPSGVEYGRLLDIGRAEVDRQVGRPIGQRLVRSLLREFLARSWPFAAALGAGRLVRAMLPPALKNLVRPAIAGGTWPHAAHKRKMILLDGCVQPALAPATNAATARVLDRLGVELVVARRAGCCGAIRHHLDDTEGALDDARDNIDAWWPYIDEAHGGSAEAIVMTASGCGAMVKDYGHLLADDPLYARKAARIAGMTRDLCEVLQQFLPQLAAMSSQRSATNAAYHPPCTLQHGQQIRGQVERLLGAAGVEVKLCADSHLCCGSAGTYSLLQPVMSRQLREAKLARLAATGADMIVTANIGCQAHLQGGTATPVRHWIELLDNAMVSS